MLLKEGDEVFSGITIDSKGNILQEALSRPWVSV